MEEKKKANKGGMIILILICILGIGYYLFSHTTLLDSYLIPDQSESEYVGTWVRNEDWKSDTIGTPAYQLNSDGTGYEILIVEDNSAEAENIFWEDTGDGIKITFRKYLTSYELSKESEWEYIKDTRTSEEICESRGIPFKIIY